MDQTSVFFLVFKNRLVLAGSLAVIMAPFKRPGQDGRGRKAPPSYLLVFLSEWSCRITELRLNPVPSYLPPPPPPPWRAPASVSSSLRPRREPGAHHGAGGRARGTVIVCLHYLCRRTFAGKWLRNAISHSCHPALPSIRLTTSRDRPGSSAGCRNHQCEKSEVGCLIGGSGGVRGGA